MWHPYAQPDTSAAVPFVGPPGSVFGWREKHPLRLSIETLMVTAGTIALLGLLNRPSGPDYRWFIIPSLLVSAALVPTWLRKEEFPRIGLDRQHLPLSLGTVCHACIYVFPAIFLVLWWMTSMRLPIPLKPVIAAQHNWVTWLLYQFLYVAVAEELFFRGYVQANVMRLLRNARWGPSHRHEFVGMLASAGCFALAHVVVRGQTTALVTFAPGLLFAWLFVRTRTLLAPILLHGLANVSYGIMALTLA